MTRTVEYPIAVAKKDFAQVLRRALHEPVIITRRGQPEVVMIAYDDYLRLQRLQAYEDMVRISTELRERGVRASEVYAASRAELESRP